MKKFFQCLSKFSQFFQEDNGTYSNIRLITFITIVDVLILSDVMLFFAIKKYMLPGSTETLMQIALAIATLIGSVSSVVGILKVMQKQTEENVKRDQPLNTTTDDSGKTT